MYEGFTGPWDYWLDMTCDGDRPVRLIEARWRGSDDVVRGALISISVVDGELFVAPVEHPVRAQSGGKAPSDG